MNSIKLTQYSHGAGCGCKISPKVLAEILHSDSPRVPDPRLLVGNDTRDDAAVYAMDDETVVISTTDFFMPIVDDPFDFGGIASVNALSDVYAMGGTPMMAIAILGWPVNKIDPAIAGMVLEGAREVCGRAGIPLAGGHSIDAPEPIFGLAVTGHGKKKHIKTNDKAKAGHELYLTKPLGIGILTTAQKKGLLKESDFQTVRAIMLTLNRAGQDFGLLESISAMTDVTGFGLLGHLSEICEGSHLNAEISFDKVPKIQQVDFYIAQNSLPGGTQRNFESYGHNVSPMTPTQQAVLCDPQTSGGLLVAVDPDDRAQFLGICDKYQIVAQPFGQLTKGGDHLITVV